MSADLRDFEFHTFRPRCGQPTRGGKGRTCQLATHHAGHHSAVTYDCDGCGQAFRGKPFATARDGEFEDGLGFCLPCAKGLR